MGYDVSFVLRLTLAVVVFLTAGATAFATTLPFGSMPVTQRLPGQTVCHWTVYTGDLYVAGSDAFADVCHCGTYCQAYANPPASGRKLHGVRQLSTAKWRWGNGRGFGRDTSFSLFQSGLRSSFGATPCTPLCRLGADGRLRNERQQVVATVAQAVPLPQSAWLLLLSLSALLCHRRVAGGVACPPYAAVRHT